MVRHGTLIPRYKDMLGSVCQRQTQNLSSLREKGEAMPNKEGPLCSMRGLSVFFTLNTHIFWSSEQNNRIKTERDYNYSNEDFSKTQRNLILTLIALI